MSTLGHKHNASMRKKAGQRKRWREWRERRKALIWSEKLTRGHKTRSMPENHRATASKKKNGQIFLCEVYHSLPLVRGCGEEDECGLWQMDDREPGGSRQKSPEPL